MWIMMIFVASLVYWLCTWWVTLLFFLNKCLISYQKKGESINCYTCNLLKLGIISQRAQQSLWRNHVTLIFCRTSPETYFRRVLSNMWIKWILLFPFLIGQWKVVREIGSWSPLTKLWWVNGYGTLGWRKCGYGGV